MSGPDLAARRQRQVIRARGQFDCALNAYRLAPSLITKAELIVATYTLHALEPWAGSIDDVMTTIFEGGAPCSAA